MVTRPEPLEATRGVAPEVVANVAPAITAVPTSRSKTVAHERFIRPDDTTVYCRGPADDTLGSAAPPLHEAVRRSRHGGTRRKRLEPAYEAVSAVMTLARFGTLPDTDAPPDAVITG